MKRQCSRFVNRQLYTVRIKLIHGNKALASAANIHWFTLFFSVFVGEPFQRFVTKIE